MSYYPYFRGKSFELVTIHEMMNKVMAAFFSG